jgi:hypothetical protein
VILRGGLVKFISWGVPQSGRSGRLQIGLFFVPKAYCGGKIARFRFRDVDFVSR